MYAVSSRIPSAALAAFALIFFSIGLFFGGNFLFAQGLLPVLCAVFMALSLSFPLRFPSDTPARLLLAGIIVPLALAFIYIVAQIAPLSQASSWASPFWNLLADNTWASISVAPGTTFSYALMALGYAAAAFGLFRIGQGRPQAIVAIVSVIITLLSLYGIVVYSLGNATVLWLPKTSYPDSLTATFINRNSFATYAGLGILASMAMGLQRVGEISSRLDTRQRLRAFILLVLKPGWPWMLAALICFVALVLTSSRAGLTASLCGIIVLLGSLAGMRAPVRLPLSIIIGLIIIMSLFVLSAIGGTVGSRLSRVSEDANLRQSIYQATGNLIAQHPVTGSGFGTYQEAIGTARSPQVLSNLSTLIDHAHNTYLELTAELGYFGVSFLAIAAFCLLVMLINGLRIRRRAIIWPALGVSTLVLVGGHALADFSLSIPAVALTALALLMVPLSQSFPLAESATPAHQRKRVNLAFLSVALVLILLSTWQTAANYHAMAAGSTVRAILNGKPVTRSEIFLAQNHLRKCLNINPWHPTCSFSLAHTHMALANAYGVSGPRRDVALVYLFMSQDQYLEALKQNPTNALAWYRLARIKAYMGHPEEAVTYLANSVLTGPSEPFIGQQRIPLMLSLMNNADPENARLFTDNIIALWEGKPRQVGLEIRLNPVIQKQFADVVAHVPESELYWRRYVRAPLPASLTTSPTLGE